MEPLLEAIGARFRSEVVRRELRLPPSAGRLRAQLYALGAVRAEEVDESGDWRLQVELKPQSLASLRKSPDFASLLPAS
jgi:GTP-binding protein HflX